MGDWLAHITVKPITKDLLPDVRWLAERLRNRDDMELKATDTQLETFAVDVDYENYIAYVDGQPLLLFGVSRSVICGYGHVVWCVARQDLYQHYKKEFVALGRQVLPKWKRRFPKMWNMITQSNEKSRRWLKSFGAEFSKPFLYKDMSWQLFFVKGDEKHVRRTVDDGPYGHTGNQSVQPAKTAV
jgi:hypothetical protein